MIAKAILPGALPAVMVGVRLAVGRAGADSVSAVAETDDALNLVPAPADRDLFSDDPVLVEAVERHEAKAHLARLRDLGRLAGTPRSVRWAELVDRFGPTLRTHDPFARRVDEVEYHPAWHRLLQCGGQAGMTGDRVSFRWFGPLKYFAEQAGLLLGFWFVVWAAAAV